MEQNPKVKKKECKGFQECDENYSDHCSATYQWIGGIAPSTNVSQNK